MMRLFKSNKSNSVLVSALLFIILAAWSSTLLAQGSKSVVRIRVNNADVGTGFVYNSTRQVVTALHVVAGHSNITVYSESTGNSSPATLEKVFKESDLALLTLSNDLGLEPLSHNTNPRITEDHTIWGYPRNVATKQGDLIRFSRSEKQETTLNSILKSGDKLLSQLKLQGYPSPSTRILRIGSIIQPGHSGAPIMNSADEVVGVADGGLYGGTARINWAIHAQYLPMLVADGIGPADDGFPSRPSVQSELFGNQNQRFSTAEKVNFTNDKDLYFVMRVPLGEIYDYLPQEEQENLDFYIENFTTDWRSYTIDVYEDAITGATISVPEGFTLSYDTEMEWFTAKSEGIYEMIVVIDQRDSWADALNAKDLFIEDLDYLKDWDNGPNVTISDYTDEEDGFFSGYRDWETFNPDSSQQSLMSAALNIDYNNFFGTAYLTHNVQIMDFNKYYLLNLCLQLATFPIN
ncbi:MAG: serine protease [Balneolaceae bacterium]|nr:serine protease [Balneolaceae bacterium]